jgi:hypothetical protein
MARLAGIMRKCPGSLSLTGILYDNKNTLQTPGGIHSLREHG